MVGGADSDVPAGHPWVTGVHCARSDVGVEGTAAYWPSGQFVRDVHTASDDTVATVDAYLATKKISFVSMTNQQHYRTLELQLIPIELNWQLNCLAHTIHTASSRSDVKTKQLKRIVEA